MRSIVYSRLHINHLWSSSTRQGRTSMQELNLHKRSDLTSPPIAINQIHCKVLIHGCSHEIKIQDKRKIQPKVLLDPSCQSRHVRDNPRRLQPGSLLPSSTLLDLVALAVVEEWVAAETALAAAAAGTLRGTPIRWHCQSAAERGRSPLASTSLA